MELISLDLDTDVGLSNHFNRKDGLLQIHLFRLLRLKIMQIQGPSSGRCERRVGRENKGMRLEATFWVFHFYISSFVFVI